jgi:UPF0755 protein
MGEKLKIKFWEYLWYGFVTLFLLGIGLVLSIFWIVKQSARILGKPGLSWRFLLSVTFVVALVLGWYVWHQYTHKIDLGKREVVLVVKPGDKFSAIVDRLYAEHVVDTRVLLNYPARWMKLDTRLIPGEYRFFGKNSARSVLQRLARGEGVQVRLTIIEGLPIWRVASELKRQMGIDSSKVMQLARDSGLAARLGVPSLEGYLFPETYLFAPGTDAQTVITSMVKMFLSRTTGIWDSLGTVGLTKPEAMVMASIIQAETGLASEEGKVASVYHNRLRLGMSLDADPTVIYGLGGLDRPLTKDDLERPTKFNTYLNPGLPPSPINSPGMAAIQAALHPEMTDYLYFVADGSGGHIFSKTNEQHNEARRRARILQRMNHRP